MIVDVFVTLYVQSKYLQSSFCKSFAFLIPSLSRNEVVSPVFVVVAVVFKPRVINSTGFINVNSNECDQVLFFTECLNLKTSSSSLK